MFNCILTADYKKTFWKYSGEEGCDHVRYKFLPFLSDTPPKKSLTLSISIRFISEKRLHHFYQEDAASDSAVSCVYGERNRQLEARIPLMILQPIESESLLERFFAV